MKVNITKDSKKVITLEEIDAAKHIVQMFKDEDTTAKWYAELALGCFGSLMEVVSASAEICKDSRPGIDRIDAGTGYLNVWINATGKVWTDDGPAYIEVGFLVSDIWDLTTENKKEISSRMFAQIYKKA